MMTRGILRYSIVTSGKRLTDEEVDQVCESIRKIKEETNIEVCFSFGLLKVEQLRKVREAGATRAHCNLETSRRYFPEICTTHTYDQKIETLKAAVAAGLSICSGGIMGLGETLEDRVDMVLTVKELGVKSVPVNFLNPIPGTPYEDSKPLTDEEARQCVAVFGSSFRMHPSVWPAEEVFWMTKEKSASRAVPMLPFPATC